MHDLFSTPWANAWEKALNNNAIYRNAAEKWEWPVILEIEDLPTESKGLHSQLYLDLWRGQCRSVRPAEPEDNNSAAYIISAPLNVWRPVLDGHSDPMMALMRGKLKLVKGKMFKLARYSNAAKQMVLSAREVPTRFPGEDSETAVPAAANGTQSAEIATKRESFVTTSGKGLNNNSFPMRLYHKAKRLGIWNPQDINIDQDKQDWQKLTALEKEVILHLTSLFQAGEESVTQDILPLLMVLAREGRLEEEIYLTTFLWEEAKHVEFFHRYLSEVITETGDISRFHGPNYRRIFYELLPEAMNALLEDPSPAAQIRASVTYNMIVEGTLAETGYHAYYTMLERNDIMPGMREGITYLKRDESRHIAYGIYLLSRLVNSDPSLWQVLENRMEVMMNYALANINELFDAYPEMPFGLSLADFVDYATNQFNKRMDRIERAISTPMDKIANELESD